MLDWDREKAKKQIQKIEAPLLYLEAKDRICDLEEFAKLSAKFESGRVANSGHLVSLEEPCQVNALIEKFLLTKSLKIR